MIQPAIGVYNVSKSFNEVQALCGIDLQIAEGRFYSLLGPSGCGKTTLLRLIAGFEEPSGGSITIGGKSMSAVPPHRRPVNMVFQSYALFPHLTVFDNVAFGLKCSKTPAAEIPERVQEALELVRLPHLAARYPRELSGGQQQRIAFARAIVNRPFVLLLDEPLSALDPRIRQEMQAELARFKKELGITFVMVTHDQSEAFALSDQIAVFNGGRIEQVGTPQEIYEAPASAFVADFIGSTNVFQAVVSIRDDERIVVRTACGLNLVARNDLQSVESVDGHATRLANNLANRTAVGPVGEPVAVWIRTDSIALAASAGVGAQDRRSENNPVSGDEPNRLRARLIHRSYQGSREELLLSVGDLKLTAAVPALTAALVAGEVDILIPQSCVHILPAGDLPKSNLDGRFNTVASTSV